MTYDLAGNLKSDGSQAYTYDATGQQTEAKTAGVVSLQQWYDGDRLRVKKMEAGEKTYYVRSSVLGGKVVAELNGSGVMKRGYVYVGGQMLAIQDKTDSNVEQVTWVHQDPVTKSQRFTSSTGAMLSQRIDLDPWGVETAKTVDPTSLQQKPVHRFTTYERDANGTDEAMHRRYNSVRSRFEQPDPWDGSYDLTNPQSLNRYSYVQNDPVNFVDPSGLTDQRLNDGIEAARNALEGGMCQSLFRRYPIDPSKLLDIYLANNLIKVGNNKLFAKTNAIIMKLRRRSFRRSFDFIGKVLILNQDQNYNKYNRRMYNPNPNSKQGRCRRHRKKRSGNYNYSVYSGKFAGCQNLPCIAHSQVNTDYSTEPHLPL